jgi:type III secretion system FlhB-like substrate exporter
MKEEKIASAIAYDAALDEAPRLLATGQGSTAQQIIKIAEDSGIKIVEDNILAEVLNKHVDIGEIIPVWCWEAAAKILAFVKTVSK